MVSLVCPRHVSLSLYIITLEMMEMHCQFALQLEAFFRATDFIGPADNALSYLFTRMELFLTYNFLGDVGNAFSLL